VFNAAQQLRAQGLTVPQAPAPVAAPRPTPAPAPQPISSVAPAAVPTATPPAPAIQKASDDTLWIHDDLDLDNLDLDEELAKLEQQEQQLSQQFLALEASNRTPQTFEAAPQGEALDQDERWAEALLREDSARTPLQLAPQVPAAQRVNTDVRAPATPAANPAPTALDDLAPSAPPEPAAVTRTEPTISLAAEWHEPPAPPKPRAAALSAMRDDEPGEDDLDQDPPLEARPKRSRHEPALRDEALLNLSEDPLDLDWQQPRSPWGRWLGWGLLNLLAASALAGQYVHYHFEELARQDQYRPWFEQLCPSLGCTLPSKVDISQIKSSNLVVRSHPEFSGALVVDAILYNRAPFAQPFPLLEMRFADINGQLLASRRFKPSEYLAGELAGRAEMPTQTPIHVSLDILDPGARAVNYSLSFHSPE
jgi:hypothetical protein